jgi:hypothetical protein
MNIKKTIAKKVAVAFPDAAMKPVPMPRPATNVKPINMDFKRSPADLNQPGRRNPPITEQTECANAP